MESHALRQKAHYIFGYGSLICSKSRAITAPTTAHSPAHPAIVNHYQRTWTARGRYSANSIVHEDKLNVRQLNKLKGGTAMGVRYKEGYKVTGVLIPVNEEELSQFDIREAGYDRVLVDLDHVSAVPGLPHPDMIEKKEEFKEEMGGDIHVWIYVQQEPILATRHFPIAQSYVDIILRGCLSISEDFVRSFLETTHGWFHEDYCPKNDVDDDGEHFTWIDDRHFPLYPRADAQYSKEMAERLDSILQEHHGEALRRRRSLKMLSASEKYSDEFD